jgi:hypothetical protein
VWYNGNRGGEQAPTNKEMANMMKTIAIRFDSETILMVHTNAERDDVVNAQRKVGGGQYDNIRAALMADGFRVGETLISDIVIDWQ